MIDADIDPALVDSQIIDPIGNGAAQFLDQEIVNPNRLGIAVRTPPELVEGPGPDF